jgi:hypothetical protein
VSFSVEKGLKVGFYLAEKQKKVVFYASK